MLTCLGANPSTMAYAEVFTGLQQGTIDGQENPNSTIVDAKFYEVQKYLTLTEHVYGFLVLHMGNSFYEGLKEEEKKAVVENKEETDTKQNENEESTDSTNNTENTEVSGEEKVENQENLKDTTNTTEETEILTNSNNKISH